MAENLNIYEATAAWLGKRGEFFAESVVTSTNDIAKAEAAELLKHGIKEKVYIAGTQTNGRGRGKNTWLTPPAGHALLMTWSWHLERPPQAITGPVMGLHCYQAITNAFRGADFRLKPPNDIYLGEKKILGLLAEAIQQGSQHRLILGMGLNVHSAPKEIENAGCLMDYCADKEILTAEQWGQFMDDLTSQLREAVQKAQAPHLSLADCGRLLEAISRQGTEQYIRVHPNGDLETAEHKIISWRSL